MKPCLFLAVLIALAACSPSQPTIVGAAPPGISYRVEQGPTDDTNRRAATYCGHYGKEANFQGVTDDAGARLAQYACS